MIDSAEEFVRLRSSEVMEEYNRAAQDEASIEVWLDVIERFPDYKTWVIHNKTVPLKILVLLSDDPDSDVRGWVAEKRKLSHALFMQLAQDPEEWVRQRIACNAKAPDDALRLLIDDSNEDTRERARERLGLAED